MAEGLRNGFELLAIFAERNKNRGIGDSTIKVKAIPLDTTSMETPHSRKN